MCICCAEGKREVLCCIPDNHIHFLKGTIKTKFILNTCHTGYYESLILFSGMNNDENTIYAHCEYRICCSVHSACSLEKEVGLGPCVHACPLGIFAQLHLTQNVRRGSASLLCVYMVLLKHTEVV